MRTLRTLWKCRDGTTILMSEMTEAHLENAKAYCQKRGDIDSFNDLCLESDRRKLQNKLDQELDKFVKANSSCQFCGCPLKPKRFEYKSDPEEGPGMGWSYSEYKLVCQCGAMGPAIKTKGIKAS